MQQTKKTNIAKQNKTKQNQSQRKTTADPFVVCRSTHRSWHETGLSYYTNTHACVYTIRRIIIGNGTLAHNLHTICDPRTKCCSISGDGRLDFKLYARCIDSLHLISLPFPLLPAILSCALAAIMTILFTTDGNRQQCTQYLRIYFALVGPTAVFHVV